MSSRNPNYRLVKTHRNYSVDEVARLFAIHKNTVRAWVKAGLPTCDNRRPMLILGRDLSAFLLARRVTKRRPCGPGQIYCVRCRVPRHPAGSMVDCEPTAGTLGNLIGICPACDSMIYRRVNLAKIEQIRGDLQVTMQQG